MIRYTIALLFVAFISTVAMAQPLTEVTYETKIATADEAFNSGDFYNAAEWYEQAYKERKDRDFAIKVAECYMNLRNYKRATSWFKRVLSRDRTESYGEYKLEYGNSLKIMGEYNDAYAILNEFVNETEDLERKKQAVLLINGIAKSSDFEDNIDAIIKPVHRNVNSPSSEAGPRSYGAELYYSSLNRKDELIYNGKLEGETHFKIYTTALNDKGDYEKGSALSDEINREGYHTGNPSFSADGQIMYFTRMLIEEGELLESKVYYSNRKGPNWGPSDMVEGDMNGDYLIKYPAVGELYGRDVLFFSAQIEGGFGGYDIYYSEKTGENTFGTPVNLGETINTSYDEMTPFYREGEFFFSTEGYPGFGGMDIFKTTWDGTQWSEVTNMGSGYNSTYDDMYYTLDEAGLQGFLVSNRPAERKRSVMSKTCCDDIFSVNMKELVIDLKALITDGTDPLKEATVKLIDLTEGDEKADPEIKNNLSSNDFNFALDADKPYRVVINRKGYYSDSIEFNTVGILDDYTVERTIALKEIPIPPPPKEETVIVTVNEPIRMNNIYYDLDSDVILKSAEGDLNYILEIMNDYPTMVIELSSHTDAQGLSRYNEDLSQRRANSAKQYLLDRGIAPDRIQAVGYGEEVLLNRCVNGVRCSDEEHQFNRRTEFKIISGPQTIEIKKQTTRPINSGGGLPDHTEKSGYSSVSQDELPLTTFKFAQNDYQLGKIKLGDKVNMEYVFENTGDNPLLIEVVTACHCTTFEYPAEPIKAGEKAVITTTFDSKVKARTGTFREVINIICNTENMVEEAIFHVTVED